MIEVIVADDHPIFRKGVVYIVEQCPNVTIIGEAEDGIEAVELIKLNQPQIAILDIDMPKMTGLDVIRQLKGVNSKCKFIILTMLKEVELYHEVKEIGIEGYLLKDSAAEKLIDCIKAVANESVFIDPIILSQLENNKTTSEILNSLTKSEKNIIKLIARKMSTKTIAEMLFISTKTVENHRSNICKKLKLKGTNPILNFIVENKISHI
jgi:DNA-binding NarL/FixJ family response regulator